MLRVKAASDKGRSEVIFTTPGFLQFPSTELMKFTAEPRPGSDAAERRPVS